MGSCWSEGCGEQALVQWRRRPTGGELAVAVEVAQGQQDGILAAVDPELPPPALPPMPGEADTTAAVYACGPHSVTMDLATRVHQATCTAPDPAVLPGCGCTPEPLPPPAPGPLVQPRALPAHWT